MITRHDIAQGSEQWLAARLGKYTGSNAYKLLSSYGANEYAKNIESTFGGNFYTKRGHILEDEAIDLYEQIRHCSVDRPGYVTNTKYPDCLYSPDGIDNVTLLEVKCFNAAKHNDIAGGNIPLNILAQIHFGLLITGLKAARLIIYNPDLPPAQALKIIPIKHNPAISTNFKNILKREFANA